MTLTTRRLAALVLAAAPLLALTPAPAQACTGPVCDAICDAWNSKPGQKVFDGYCPLG